MKDPSTEMAGSRYLEGPLQKDILRGGETSPLITVVSKIFSSDLRPEMTTGRVK